MTRIRKINKHVNTSISITKEQSDFLTKYPTINLSRIVQMHLQELIDWTKIQGG